MREFYLTLRSQKQLDLNSSSQELILYLLKTLGLNAEVIDFCSLESVSKNKQLRDYYISESLL